MHAEERAPQLGFAYPRGTNEGSPARADVSQGDRTGWEVAVSPLRVETGPRFRDGTLLAGAWGYPSSTTPHPVQVVKEHAK